MCGSCRKVERRMREAEWKMRLQAREMKRTAAFLEDCPNAVVTSGCFVVTDSNSTGTDNY